MSEVVGRDAVPSHEDGSDARATHLTKNETTCVMQAAPVYERWVQRFQFGYKCGEVPVATVHAFQENVFVAFGVQGLLHFFGKALPIDSLVVQQGYPLAGISVGDNVSGDGALLIIAANCPKYVPTDCARLVAGSWRPA